MIEKQKFVGFFSYSKPFGFAVKKEPKPKRQIFRQAENDVNNQQLREPLEFENEKHNDLERVIVITSG